MAEKAWKLHTVGTYLIKKIHECGVEHIFGVPGFCFHLLHHI